jgi:hypothetical protein
MRPAAITALIGQLNTRLFKGNLLVEHHPTSPPSPLWILRYESGGVEWASRVCWLKTSRTFEMRHGGGGNFAWWIDNAITNEIAVQYGGKLTDDGCEGTLDAGPGRFDDLHTFLAGMTTHMSEATAREYLAEMNTLLVPPEFRKPVDGAAV